MLKQSLIILTVLVGVGGQADPLQRPARVSAMASQRLITSVVAAGPDSLVAVGQRGHVLRSRDAGATWIQAPAPVSSDLTAVQFLNARQGFAVGHDGVVLGSVDGGDQWTVLLDGKAANTLVLAQLQSAPADGDRARLLGEAQRNLEAGPDKPFLDLYFSSPSDGFVVGAYNLILETRDGGNSWHSWYERSDNSDKLFNLYSVLSHKGQIFVAGEGGMLMRLNKTRSRFERLDTGYQGSFFGLLDAGESLIAYGMRGNAVISRDSGATWSSLTTGLQASITAAAKDADGRLWLGDQHGHVSVSRDGGHTFSAIKLPVSTPLAAMHVTASTLVLAGARGVRGVPLPKE
jgi:photosystem II stability/assembly factor-like uncharacterized protein